jgi:RNA polymerase-binding protein DksA
MQKADFQRLREHLLEQRAVLKQRLDTIHEHARNPLERDSEEQAAQLGNLEVVSALENEAAAELNAIDLALQRLEDGSFGICSSCGEPVGDARLAARPSAAMCVKCAA